MNRRKLIIIGAGIVLVAGAAIAGPIIYSKTQDDAPPPLSVTEPTASSSTTTGVLETEGTWKVGTGSQAGYRVDEVLNGQDLTVVGRTQKVTGEVRVESGEVISAEIVIDTASIKTDRSSRDSYFRSEALKVGQFPTATFTLDIPIPIPDLGSKPAEASAEGQLTLTDVARSVKADLKIARTDNGVAVSGSIPVTFADFDIDAPSLGFVKVKDKGSVEFLINLER